MKAFSCIGRVSFWVGVLQLLATNHAAAQTNYQRLKSFGATDSGTHPHTALLLAGNGVLYGTTGMGGAANRGTIFSLNADGSGYTVLHEFSANFDGENPVGALLQGQDGALYGTTEYGGSNRFGSIFTIATNGSNYAVLHHFKGPTGDDGFNPFGRLLQDSSGYLYGTANLTAVAGSPALGAVYKLKTDGTGFTNLDQIPGSGEGGLIQGEDGALYGVSRWFSSTKRGFFKLNTDGSGFKDWNNIPNCGIQARMTGLCQGTNGLLYGATSYRSPGEAIYSIGTNGSGYATLHTFSVNGVDGQNPDTQLLLGLDGAFYGTTAAGGTNGQGTIFKINGDGNGYAILHHFQSNNVDGRWPEDSLVQGADGTLYGTTLNGGFSDEGTVYAINQDGSNYRQLHQFNHFASEGQAPSGSLAPDGGGWLYGTTQRGGNGGNGTLFKIGLDGNGYSIVRHFGGSGDGQWPSGQLLLGEDGAWYGTTCTGGSNNYGTIFRIYGDGTGYAPLYSFSGTNDGDVPCDALVQDPSGALYGITAAGGGNSVGTVFKVNTNGSGFVLLHTFLTNGVDGASPIGGLLLGDDGALYGVTEAGGTNNAGTVFKLETDGSAYTRLHSFGSDAGDGIAPGSALLRGRNGALYGATQSGGAEGAGAVFALNTDGSGYQIIQSLSSSLTNSLSFRRASCALTLASGNTLYGTLYEGGVSNDYGGLILQVGIAGANCSTVHDFGTSPGDGHNPAGGIVLAGASWYGTTKSGGDLGDGSIYSLPVIGPEIATQLESQTVLAGANVMFDVDATGSPADYQWLFNGQVLTNATGPDLYLPGVGRANAGIYCLTISNAAGMVTDNNAVLTVDVPVQLYGVQFRPGGSVRITSGYSDGWPLTSIDLGRFSLQASSNLVDWVTLTSAVNVSNGLMILNDNVVSNQTSRFYRVSETP